MACGRGPECAGNNRDQLERTSARGTTDQVGVDWRGADSPETLSPLTWRSPLRRVNNLETIPRNHTYGYKTMTQLHNENGDTKSFIHLTYDHAADRLSTRWIDSVERIAITGWGRTNYPVPYLIYRWAEQPKGILVCNALTGTMTVRPYQLDIREVSARDQFSVTSPRAHMMRSDEDRDSFPLGWCGDRAVLCVASDDGLQLWFFNPDFVPDIPDAEPFLAMEESG